MKPLDKNRIENEGRQAYANGDKETDCPYTIPEARRVWRMGFAAAGGIRMSADEYVRDDDGRFASKPGSGAKKKGKTSKTKSNTAIDKFLKKVDDAFDSMKKPEPIQGPVKSPAPAVKAKHVKDWLHESTNFTKDEDGAYRNPETGEHITFEDDGSWSFRNKKGRVIFQDKDLEMLPIFLKNQGKAKKK